MPRLALSPWIKDERNETKYQIIRWQSASFVLVQSSRNMILLEHCWLNGQERVVTGPFTWQPTENLVCRSQSSTARSRWFEGGKPSDLPFGVGVFSLPQKTAAIERSIVAGTKRGSGARSLFTWQAAVQILLVEVILLPQNAPICIIHIARALGPTVSRGKPGRLDKGRS
jgi:hypothetical protein